MDIEREIKTALSKISVEELSYYVAHSRSEQMLIKRLSQIIQQEIGDRNIVRNEYSDKNSNIEKADLVIFEKNNRENIKAYVEAKWLFSHHLYDEKAWIYKEKSHNHHRTIKKDFAKILSAKNVSGDRSFLLFITHYKSIVLPDYWTDMIYHKRVFNKYSLEINDIKAKLEKRIKEVIMSIQGFDMPSINIKSELTMQIQEISLISVEEVPISLLYVIINLNNVYTY